MGTPWTSLDGGSSQRIVVATGTGIDPATLGGRTPMSSSPA